MVCPVAIAAVRKMLPPPAINQYHRQPIPAMSAEAIFEEINWWTLATIREALAELVKYGEATKTGKFYRKARYT